MTNKNMGHEYIFELNHGEHLEKSFFSVKKDDRVVYRTGPSLFGREVFLYTELPEPGASFTRGEYRLCAMELAAWLPGSFHYYFTQSRESEERLGSGYVHVEPEVKLGAEVLPIECVESVTVLSKCLGHHSTWLDRLEPARDAGYNMIHFSPVQELGRSGSCYCLLDQLKVTSGFSTDEGPLAWEQLSTIISTLRNDWKMSSICDIVLNHSANESVWLSDHPECTYNLKNSPHLRPAYVLDLTLNQVSRSVAGGELTSKGIPPILQTEDHLNALRYYLLSEVLVELKLHEMFTVDVDGYLAQFQVLVNTATPSQRGDSPIMLTILQDPDFRRLRSTIDMQLAQDLFNVYRVDCYDEDTRRRRCCEAFKHFLEELNSKIEKEVASHLDAAVNASIASVRYMRIDEKGPRKEEITNEEPLFPRYFYDGGIGSEENAYNGENGCNIWAHNGWVMDYDPLLDFAQPGSNVYLRRELIPWGDSVKLKYGEKEEDCPFLWDHMKKYVQQTAKIFDGVRLDNCHSTPIPVAQYMLDAARKIKPNLYIVAELFTNSDTTDNLFMNKLGITSLIRESMSGWDSHEVGRLVYRYGGDVVGSLTGGKPRPRKLAPALFMDLTHDNPHPTERRTIYDLIPASALVAVATCASGSTFGYDQLVPHQINVVTENRLYMTRNHRNFSKGIGGVKLAFNKLHFALAKEGYSQVFVDQIDADIVAVTRFNPTTLESVILISYTAFSWPSDHASALGKGITVSGIAHSVLLHASLRHRSEKAYTSISDYKKDNDVINGLLEYEAVLEENMAIDKCSAVKAVPTKDSVRLNLTQHFKPGHVVAIRVVSKSGARAAAECLTSSKLPEIEKAVFRLDLSDLNYVLYRSPGEGGPAYHVPNYGDLVYQGLQGVVSVLEDVAASDDLGHPLCANLREGSWLTDFIVTRLKSRPSTNYLGELLARELSVVGELPVSLRPWGFFRIFTQVHTHLQLRAISLLSIFVQEGGELVRQLSLCSVQLMGEISKLPPLSERIAPPQPPLQVRNGVQVQILNTLAAGLPHFSSGLMRCWGRDTFIALRGLLLLTGRLQEARYHILGFGGCLRHGLIPNLLNGEGLAPRYNSRDAVFWWLHSIKEYVELAGNTQILTDIVSRLFPTDEAQPTFTEQTLSEVMYEALSVHFQGLVFRERNAGKQIDEHMNSEGFDNQIGVHPETGFVFGGSKWNCGTWMDKMGSSWEAGTKGKPATPRDGSPIEMVALQWAVINWLHKLSLMGEFPFQGVSRTTKQGETISWSWSEWSGKIKANFEEKFWVGEDCLNGYVNRRKIYKDTFGATDEWADFRLRPNFAVAMVVAGELFDKTHAASALATAKVLEGPLGMKTLDPSDLAYCGFYDNGNQSSDYRVAHGYNYHQGPEWLWLSGYYMRARLKFCRSESVVSEVQSWLGRAWAHLRSSPWRGLPELTNENGAPCHDSCPTQAWSAATFLEVLYDLRTHQQPPHPS